MRITFDTWTKAKARFLPARTTGYSWSELMLPQAHFKPGGVRRRKLETRKWKRQHGFSVALCVLLTCAACSAQLALNNSPFAALLNSTGNKPFRTELFEGPGFQNLWFTNTASPDAALNSASTTAPAPIQGSFSLRIALSADTRNATNFYDPSSEMHLAWMVRFPTLPVGRPFLYLNNGPTNLISVILTDNGGVNDVPYVSDGTVSNTISGTVLNTTTTNFMWLDYTKGTGANANYTLSWGVTGIRSSAASVSVTTGLNTQVTDNMVVGSTNARTWTGVFDYFQWSLKAISDIVPP